jgi:membrane protein DedA with SNARE-associated domain
MKQRFKQRLPFALWAGLVFLIGFGLGFRLIDASSGWQPALLGIAVVVVATAPDLVVWLRSRRSR